MGLIWVHLRLPGLSADRTTDWKIWRWLYSCHLLAQSGAQPQEEALAARLPMGLISLQLLRCLSLWHPFWQLVQSRQAPLGAALGYAGFRVLEVVFPLPVASAPVPSVLALSFASRVSEPLRPVSAVFLAGMYVSRVP